VDGEPLIEAGSIEVFERWLEVNGASATAVWVAIYKKASKKQVVTYAQLLEVGLCFGWIDVKERRLDDERYAIRFVPRRPKSTWSEINRALARRLIAEGRMRPAGKAKLPADL
jgi:uncharacterized protein YdeI (YjbR/CyaY-like superfamily)